LFGELISQLLNGIVGVNLVGLVTWTNPLFQKINSTELLELMTLEEKKQEWRRKKRPDLSLVSDASSGPSHYHEDDEECFHDNAYHFYSSSPSKVACKMLRVYTR
jgi:hypothetical protein